MLNIWGRGEWNISKVLRQKAEALLRKKQSEPVQELSDADGLRLVHELEVHQVELEMINDELVLANERAAELATSKYVELYDFAPSGYFTLSRNSEILELNLCGAQMLGKERSFLKNSPFSSFISKDTLPGFNYFLDKVFGSKMREACDVAISTNGHIPIYVQLAGIADQNGTHCLVTAVDITERKLAEQNLLIANIELTFQNEEKAKRAAEYIIAQKEIAYQSELLVANSYLESLIDNANAPIIIWDPQFRIMRFNRAFELLTGRKEVEVLGQPLELLFPQKLAANTMANIRKSQYGEKPETIEIEIKDNNGSVRIVLWNSATILESDGQTPIATIAQGQDITERIRFEHQLEERTKELQVLYNLSLLGVTEDLSPTVIYQKLVGFLPEGWQYPEIACARIVINGAEFCSENFRDSPWKQSAPVNMNGETIGQIEVAYLREMPNEAEGPFLYEERLLINALAEQLQQIISRIRSIKALNENSIRLDVSIPVESTIVNCCVHYHKVLKAYWINIDSD